MNDAAKRGVSFLTLLALAAGMVGAPTTYAAQAGLNTTEKTAAGWKLSDGVWTQTNGVTTIAFTTKDALVSGDVIILTFPEMEAPIKADGTHAAIAGHAAPARANDAVDNTIHLTVADSIPANTAISITMTDGLASYTPSTYAQQSVAININDVAKYPHNYGLALITNDNTTDVTATVPLFLTMSVDDVTMDLGTLSINSVKTAQQVYTVHSNNQTGVQVKVTADGDMRDQSGNTINDVADGSVSAGSEEYGFSVNNLSSTIVANAPYDNAAVDKSVPQAPTNLTSSSATVNHGTFGVTYKAAIDGDTHAGVYHQTVTTTIATNA